MAIAGYLHVTPTGAGAKTGATWAAAMDWAALVAAPPASGTVVFLKEGTYTLTGNVTFGAGAVTAPVAFIGVLSATTNVGAAVVFADWARAPANFPFIDCATFVLTIGAQNAFRNIYVQGSASGAFTSGTNGYVENCKFDCDVAVAGAVSAVSLGGNSVMVNCEVTAANGRGVSCGTYVMLYGCYIHDMTSAAQGIGVTASTATACVKCVFDNIKLYGIMISANYLIRVVNCVFYDCGTDVYATTAYSSTFINNINEASDVAGYRWSTQTDQNLFLGNHGNDTRCTDMWVLVDSTTVFQDYKVSTGDPLFTVAGSDFSIGKTSPCRGTAQDLYLGVGATVKHGNKGAWQGFTTRSTIPTTAQVLDVASGGPATWDENGDTGPGTVGAASAATMKTSSRAGDNFKIGRGFHIGG